ncbi:MAG: heme ABC exporter ATP-binding protein CcmA [Phycisphaeraceae bacterium]|nr:heme ABC exporter ATP-binding protein CcmA [Phycisphaeraceae bacterium]
MTRIAAPSTMASASTGPHPVPADAPAAAVSVQGLRKVINDRVVLNDLDFAIPRGSMFALLGANGAGKSTLLKILAGLMPPTGGRVHLFGAPLAGHAADLRSRIGFLGHNAMLYRELSARENLVFFGRMHGLADVGRRAEDLLEQLGLADRMHDPVKAFSRGMLQRAAIARALLCDPELLLADEPFTGLDAPSARTLEALLRSLHAQGRTIVFTNHDVAQSIALATSVDAVGHGGVFVLGHGRLIINQHARLLDAAMVHLEMSDR